MSSIRIALLATAVIVMTVGAMAPAVAADKYRQVEQGKSGSARGDHADITADLAQRIEVLEADLAYLQEQVGRTEGDTGAEDLATTVDQLRIILIVLGAGLAAALFEIRRLKRRLGAPGA